jgi:hypothetical protein
LSGKRGAVAPDSITIRFPTGAWEYGVSETTPAVGDTLAREGQTWVVIAVTESVDDHRVVTMALAPDVVDRDRPDLRV